MTDLEDLWNDLPVGPAPVDAILRRTGAARGAPRRRLRRSLLTVAVAGGVAAAFVAGSVVHQPRGDDPTASIPRVSAPDATPVAFHGALQTATCASLLAHYVDRAVVQVGPWGWQSTQLFTDHLESETPQFISAPVAGTMDRTAQTTRSVSSATGTNVQESGVDEPDIVKTDGRLLVRVHQGLLTVYSVTGPSVRQLGDLDLGDLHDAELLLSGTRVVVLSSGDRRTRVDTVDLSSPQRPTVVDTVSYDAPLAAARQTGADVRLILNSAPLPSLDFVEPRHGVSERDARASNVRLVRHTTLADWLPQITHDGRTTPLLDCGDVAVPRADLGLGTMAVVGFDASTPAAVQAIGLAGQAPVTYESTDHLYLASAPSSFLSRGCFDCVGPQDGGGDGRTYLYDFALDGTGATYVAAGQVDGIVSDRWSMDETHGVLRVAVAASYQTGDFTSVVTLRAQGDQLLELGRLDGLGRGEQMESVRWFDGLALLVTYRQRDPVYAVDLTRQAHPRLIGRLALPGFTSYLQPLGDMRVIGMGEGPVGHGNWGARAGLFDTSDPAHVRQLDVVAYQPGSRPRAADDPRQFTWLPRERTALTIVSRGNVGYVSALHLWHGRMTERRLPAEYGSDVPDLRLVPIPGPDGDRVVLVTGGTVSFFDLHRTHRSGRAYGR